MICIPDFVAKTWRKPTALSYSFAETVYTIIQYGKSAVNFMDKYAEILLRLLQVPRLGASTVSQILTTIDLNTLLSYDADAFYAIGWTTQQIKRWFKPERKYIDPALEWGQKSGNRIIHCFHLDYPYLLKQIESSPPVLFVQGRAAQLIHPQIAIVGSRYCSDYGSYWAKYFAAEFCAAGFAVTSGLAKGIDAHSHQAALDVQGRTVAVLGNGLNRIYPAENRPLAQAILENGGALVTEFIPDQPPVPANFPRRNRIISGLSLATLVVEASAHSGSLITARFALEQNREVFAIPGNLNNDFSQGCHKLIKQGAMLVENAKDVIENIPYYGFTNMQIQDVKDVLKATVPCPNPRPPSARRTDPQHPDLFRLIGHDLISIDELATQTGLSVDVLLTRLLDLELQDLILCENGKYRRQW